MLGLATAGFSACGGDDDETQSLTLTASGSGKDVTIEAPESADPGPAEITVDNGTDGQVDGQLLRVTGEHTPAEVAEAIVPVLEGEPCTAAIEGGDSQNATLTFTEPGEYVLYCFVSDRQGGPPHVVKGMVDKISVE